MGICPLLTTFRAGVIVSLDPSIYNANATLQAVAE